jgi:hypothetical protein
LLHNAQDRAEKEGKTKEKILPGMPRAFFRLSDRLGKSESPQAQAGCLLILLRSSVPDLPALWSGIVGAFLLSRLAIARAVESACPWWEGIIKPQTYNVYTECKANVDAFLSNYVFTKLWYGALVSVLSFTKYFKDTREVALSDLMQLFSATTIGRITSFLKPVPIPKLSESIIGTMNAP